MSKETINIPDVGTDQVEVIEICVAVGDTVAAEDSLVVLESDKASMEIPSPKAGVVTAILIANGQSVKEGDAIIELEVAGGEKLAQPEKAVVAAESAAKPVAPTEQPAAQELSLSAGPETVCVPDIGTDTAVEVIEVCVAAGDVLAEGDSMVVLESDKASMEIPAPFAGVVESVSLAVGDSVSQGHAILVMVPHAAVTSVAKPAQAGSAASQAASTPKPEAPATPKSAPVAAPPTAVPATTRQSGDGVYAGPAVRKLAREFSIQLDQVKGSGPRGRVVKEDLQSYVKSLVETRSGSAAAVAGSGIPPVPAVDFAAFGEVSEEAFSKVGNVTAANMHRNWLNVPHVTQFDDADITELENFRKSLKAEADRKGVKMTPLPFLLKACAAALKANPRFNASLNSSADGLVYKHYVHIGIAVDTPAGLVVPVLRDVDKKSLWELAQESSELADKAKNRKLKPQEMQGGCFSISSLGSIGGQGFTPIVNSPELAILGVSRLTTKPVWNGSEFVPRQMLPLSLSYDHRAINGADAGRFFTYLNEVLADIRRLLL